MGRKKRQKKLFVARRADCFVFTRETLALTQAAITVFAGELRQADHKDEKVVFAEAMVQRVVQKLTLMQASVEHISLTTFDYNEKILIRQSMLMYTVELLGMPPGPKQAKALHHCRRIALYFTDKKTGSS